MTKPDKRRPENNLHCFEGMGYTYWREQARGIQLKNDPVTNRKVGFIKGVDGYRLAYGNDANDGLTGHNGGILSPGREHLRRNHYYYRFFSTWSLRNKDTECWWGNWWIDEETYLLLRDTARDTGQPLSKTAMRRLAVPPEWGSDCAYIVRAVLNTSLGSWSGKGKAAHGGGSLASAQKQAGSSGLFGDPKHLALKQLFIPGERKDLARFITPKGFARANAGSRLIFEPLEKYLSNIRP